MTLILIVPQPVTMVATHTQTVNNLTVTVTVTINVTINVTITVTVTVTVTVPVTVPVTVTLTQTLTRTLIKGHMEMVELLLASKSDIDVQDNSGLTAYEYAIDTENTALASYLRQILDPDGELGLASP